MSGGSLVSRFLLDARVPNRVFIPDRFNEGYGLNTRMIDEIAEQKFGLLITVDYGTTNGTELEYARSLGIPTIVIDHHHVESNPPADVFVNPQQDGCNFADGTLCAAGLAWYFIIALSKRLPSAKQLDIRDYLDLACLGTICDMVPLRGPNRVIARKGLEKLTTTRRAGLRALKDVVGINKDVQCSHVGFGIGPRLNAAGRMESGELGIQLLTTTDSRKAGRLARRLNKLNQERQETEREIKDLAIERVSSLTTLPSGIVVWDEAFHTGVIGIVAQRLVENFYRPAAVCGKDGDLFKGSVRGIKDFSVVQALSDLQQYLIKFGGHDGAGGFSVAEGRISDFAAAFDSLCEERLKTIETQPSVLADTDVSFAELNAQVVHDIMGFAPFGIGNPAPVVTIRDVEVLDVQVLKGEHMKIQLGEAGFKVTGLFWKVAEHPAVFPGSRICVAGRPEVNEFGGNKTLQLNIQAIVAQD
jgi:single-stranded-DNA-specific exonuclease